ELSVANELVNILLVLAAALFGVTGFLIGFVIFMLFLISLKTLETPYLWPFIPFNAKAMLHMMLRIPVPFSNTRRSIVHPKNDDRQPVKYIYRFRFLLPYVKVSLLYDFRH